MRVLVSGGRSYANRDYVFRRLDDFHRTYNIKVIIEGRARRGVDLFAEQWANERGVRDEGYPAEWGKYGKKIAGPIRNQEMLDEGKPDVALIFPGGTGTADMRQRCEVYKRVNPDFIIMDC